MQPRRRRSFFQGVFADKIVLIGDTTRIHEDTHLTPLGEMPGVEVQANAVATLLAGTFIREAPWPVNPHCWSVWPALAALLASVWRLRRAALFLLLLLPAYFVFNVWMFVERDIFLHLVAPSIAIILTALGVLLERGLTEEQEKTRMHGLLQRYVSPQISGYIFSTRNFWAAPASGSLEPCCFPTFAGSRRCPSRCRRKSWSAG